MEPQNLLFIMSDEHNAAAMGCAGHPVVQTPNLDRLSARGTRFASAYCNSPICVPSRASFATGLHVHQTGYWDNAIAYDGTIEGWGHALQHCANRVESIGKLHYRNDTLATGFDRQHIPLHLTDGIGMVQGSIRGQFPDYRPSSRKPPKLKIVTDAGEGETSYTRYDRAIARRAVDWLEAAARTTHEKPWMLFVSFVSPHYPLRAPENFLAPYLRQDLPLPALDPVNGYTSHPWCARNAVPLPEITPDAIRTATAAYYGLCTFLDSLIGHVLDTLERCGLSETTRVIYTSDHGECLGKRGLWGKSVLYREATEVPLIATGDGLAAGSLCATPVSLIDCYPTILDALGAAHIDRESRPGRSLSDIARVNPSRVILSQYHAMGSPSAAYMVRKGRFKYHYYAGDFPAELFDIESDPDETINLADSPEYQTPLAVLDLELKAILDPDATDRRAKSDQRALVDKYGGPERVIERFARGSKGFTEIPPEFLDGP